MQNQQGSGTATLSLPDTNQQKPVSPTDQPDAERAAKSPRREYGRTSEALSKFLLRISGDVESLDREKRLRASRQQIKAHQYYDGSFYGYVDEDCQWVNCQKQDSGEVWYSDNQFYPYIRTALMELNRRNTNVNVAPAYKSEALEKIAKLAQARYNDNRDKTFSAHLKQTEDAYALLNGIVFRYTFFDFGSGRREKMPRIDKNRDSSSPPSQQLLCCLLYTSPSPRDS